MDDCPMDMQWRLPSKSLQIICSPSFLPSRKQEKGWSMGYFCFLFTSDFRVEEEKLVDKILCLFSEKQIESTLKKTQQNQQQQK